MPHRGSGNRRPSHNRHRNDARARLYFIFLLFLHHSAFNASRRVTSRLYRVPRAANIRIHRPRVYLSRVTIVESVRSPEKSVALVDVNLAFVCVPLLTIPRATFVPIITRPALSAARSPVASCKTVTFATSAFSARNESEKERTDSAVPMPRATSSRPCRSGPSKGAGGLNGGTAGVATLARRRPDGARCTEGDGGPGAAVRVQGAARVGASSVGTGP